MPTDSSCSALSLEGKGSHDTSSSFHFNSGSCMVFHRQDSLSVHQIFIGSGRRVRFKNCWLGILLIWNVRISDNKMITCHICGHCSRIVMWQIHIKWLGGNIKKVNRAGKHVFSAHHVLGHFFSFPIVPSPLTYRFDDIIDVASTRNENFILNFGDMFENFYIKSLFILLMSDLWNSGFDLFWSLLQILLLLVLWTNYGAFGWLLVILKICFPIQLTYIRLTALNWIWGDTFWNFGWWDTGVHRASRWAAST